VNWDLKKSVKLILELAIKIWSLVDVHCDEIDDSEFSVLEFSRLWSTVFTRLCEHASTCQKPQQPPCILTITLIVRNCSVYLKKFRGIKLYFLPTKAFTYKGRLILTQKRRALLSWFKELTRSQYQRLFSQDSISILGTSQAMEKLLRHLRFCIAYLQMMGYQDYAKAIDMITDNQCSAKTIVGLNRLWYRNR